MEKLISMVDEVLELESQLKRCVDQGMPFTDLQALKQETQTKIFTYANFLKQPLTLGMFISCDLDGNVLEEPKGMKCCGGIQNDCDCRGELQYNEELIKEYQEAKERVLFECFEFTLTPDDRFSKFKISNGNITFYEAGLDLSNIESIIQKADIYLTETTKKQLS